MTPTDFTGTRLAAFGLLLVGTVDCGGGPPDRGMYFYSESRPIYEDIPALVVKSDAVVSGRIAGVHSSGVDNGGEAGIPGIPMIHYNFAVTDVLPVRQLVHPSLSAGWTTRGSLTRRSQSSSDSAEVVLFLELVTREEAPGMAPLSEIYIPLGGDNGVFDIAAGLATARTQNVVSLKNVPANTSGDEIMQVPFEMLKAAIAAVRGSNVKATTLRRDA